MWLSVHIFHKKNIYSFESDRIILEVVKPFVEKYEQEKLINKYFFIRYSVNGSHVRLRLEIDSSEQFSQLKAALENHIIATFPQELHIEEVNPWNNISIFQFINYEPEIDRYGGSKGIKIAEEYFYHSSKLALCLINKIHLGNNSERLAKAIISNVVLIKKFIDNNYLISRFLKNYSTGYLRYIDEDERSTFVKAFDCGLEKQSNKISKFVEQLSSAIDENTNIDDDIDNFICNIEKIKRELQYNLKIKSLARNNSIFKSWDEVILSIFPSYLHMMNNRLGISINEESYITYLIDNVLGGLRIQEVS